MKETLTTMIHDASLQKAVATLPLDDGLAVYRRLKINESQEHISRRVQSVSYC